MYCNKNLILGFLAEARIEIVIAASLNIGICIVAVFFYPYANEYCRFMSYPSVSIKHQPCSRNDDAMSCSPELL